ncbi:MAG: sugar ABC transporter [Chloroflexi bacterium RBG_16_57_11]|nr:MAG: sugar ABC transporter [Chloroflexi bacterium RBG_16_57_11]
MTVLSGILAAAIASGTVIAFAALGELLAERTGVQNLGLEGGMAMGALAAIAVNLMIPIPMIGLLAAMAMGCILGIVFATATVTLRANQVLCGLGLAFLGTGLSGRLGASISGFRAPAPFESIRIPILADIPVIGNALFDQPWLVYVAYFILPALISYMLMKTRHGMNVRAVGENPAAADACGVSVNRVRFLYTVIGCVLAAIGGAYITLGFTPSWIEGITAGRGWIAIALVIFGAWRPLPVVLGALLFGAVTSLGFVAQIQGWGIPASFLAMLPYLGTILLMVIPIVARARREKRVGTGPAALGIPYVREGE